MLPVNPGLAAKHGMFGHVAFAFRAGSKAWHVWACCLCIQGWQQSMGCAGMLVVHSGLAAWQRVW
eukprot:511901-Lingulodinium_polyedra.AAC.1